MEGVSKTAEQLKAEKDELEKQAKAQAEALAKAAAIAAAKPDLPIGDDAAKAAAEKAEADKKAAEEAAAKKAEEDAKVAANAAGKTKAGDVSGKQTTDEDEKIHIPKKDFGKRIERAAKKRLGHMAEEQGFKSVDEMFAAIKDKKPAPAGGNGGDKDEVKKLADEVAALKRQIAETREKAEAFEAQAKLVTIDSKLMQAAADAGITDPKLRKIAVDLFRTKCDALDPNAEVDEHAFFRTELAKEYSDVKWTKGQTNTVPADTTPAAGDSPKPITAGEVKATKMTTEQYAAFRRGIKEQAQAGG